MARQVWQSMGQRDIPRGPRHYRLYLESHLAANDLDGASALLDEMAERGITGDAGVTWQIALARARSGAGGSLDHLDELARVTPIPDRLLPRVLGVRVRARQFGEARALLHKMSRAGVTGAEADYRPLLDDVLDRKAIRDAESFVAHLVAVRAGPSTETATRLVEMMAGAGHPERGDQLVQTLADGGIAVDHRARAALVDGHARKGDLAAARGAMRRLEAAGGTITSHHRNQVLAALVDRGDLPAAWNEALALSEHAIPSGANLDAMMGLALDRKKPILAIAALDWMLMLGAPPPPSKVAALLAVLLRQKELDLALSLYRETADAGLTPDRRRGSDLVEALVSAGRLDEAVKLLRQLRVSNTLTQGQHWGSLLTAHANAKRFDKVSALVTEMIAAKITPTVSDASRLVGALTSAGQLDRARLLLTTLADAGVTTDEPTYRELLWAFARKGQHEPAVAVHAAMVAAGITPDERHEKALAWASGETQRRLPDATPDQEEQAADAVVASRVAPPATPAAAPPPTAQPEADSSTTGESDATAPTGPAAPPDAPVEPGTTGVAPAGDASSALDVVDGSSEATARADEAAHLDAAAETHQPDPSPEVIVKGQDPAAEVDDLPDDVPVSTDGGAWEPEAVEPVPHDRAAVVPDGGAEAEPLAVVGADGPAPPSREEGAPSSSGTPPSDVEMSPSEDETPTAPSPATAESTPSGDDGSA